MKRIIRIQDELQEGATYIFHFWEQGSEFTKERVSKNMKLIKKYENFALFAHPSGLQETFDYWTIRKMMNGETITR